MSNEGEVFCIEQHHRGHFRRFYAEGSDDRMLHFRITSDSVNFSHGILLSWDDVNRITKELNEWLEDNE